jgi:cohesin complex subunit SCC1
MSRNLYKKQAASRFYTLLVLKKFQAVEVSQQKEFGDIWISKGPQFGLVS